MPGIVVITGLASFGMDVQRVVGTDVSIARWPEEELHQHPDVLAQRVVAEGPELVCLGPGLDLDAAFALAATVDRERPSSGVVMVAEPGSATWQKALRAGVREVVPPDATLDDLALVVHRAREMAALRRSLDEARAPERADQSRVITVLSPKGGSGKTTVATNLGVTLAKAMAGRVALVDLDLQFGDISSALQVDPVHTIGDAARAGGALDATKLKVFLAPHHSTLFTLCAPETPAEADDITAQSVSSVLNLLAGDFPVVITDTAAGLGEHALTAIDLSTDLVFVCSMDVASVRALRKELDALNRLGASTVRRHLVLNRADSRVGLTPQDIEGVLGMRVDTSLPSSREVPLSMNEGVPIVEANPRSSVSRGIVAFAERFGPVASQAQSARGLRLFRREAS